MLFRLYDEMECLGRVAVEAERRRLRSKLHHYKSGRVSGGAVFTRGQLHHLLTNPVCLGQIRHKDKVWPGLHPAIISQDLWERVQAKLAAKSARRRGAAISDGAAELSAFLTGTFRDETGDRLTPTHAQKQGKRHRYYVSNRLIASGTDPAGLRLPAVALEELVTAKVVAHLRDHAARHAILTEPDAVMVDDLANRVTAFAAEIRAVPHRHIGALITEGTITRERITMALDAEVLAIALAMPAASLAPELCVIDAALEMRRRGTGTKLISGTMTPAPDKTMIRGLALGHRWAGMHRTGLSFAEIARREGKGETFVRSRAQLAFLAPAIQTRILDGTLPPDITLERLVRADLPDDWSDQARMLEL